MKATWTSKNYTITSMDSASHSSHVLSAQGITMKYGKTIIIDDFSLSASAGSVTALVGETGLGNLLCCVVLLASSPWSMNLSVLTALKLL
ncbi:hypothetical protein [Scrofimicrobium canadense]|uniref:hypothetical protein n=1 Tax=Scrofimicrobium canadense TaxID=2652290 RepID=UPI001980712A|nr:hypothetical protein [Scrofimicrobium canadense]